MNRLTIATIAVLSIAFIGCDKKVNPLMYKVPLDELPSVIISDSRDARVEPGISVYSFNTLSDRNVIDGYIYFDIGSFSSKLTKINERDRNTFEFVGGRYNYWFTYVIPLNVIRKYPLVQMPSRSKKENGSGDVKPGDMLLPKKR